MTSDGGVMLLAAIETSLGIAARLASLIADPRNPAFVTHSVADILRARMLAIACGYEDGDDLDHLRTDPGFKLACGRSTRSCLFSGRNRDNSSRSTALRPGRTHQVGDLDLYRSAFDNTDGRCSPDLACTSKAR